MADQLLDLIPDADKQQTQKAPTFKPLQLGGDPALDAIPAAQPARATALDNIRASRELGLQPDAVLAERDLARRTGLPEAVVREHKQTAEARAWTEAADSWLMDAPDTARFLADPRNAQIAHDDVQGLSDLERQYGTIRATTADDIGFVERFGWLLHEGTKGVVRNAVGQFRGLFEFFAQKDREALESLPPEVREKILAQREEAEGGTLSGLVQVLPDEAAKVLTDTVKSEKLAPDMPLPTSGIVQQYWSDVVMMAPQIGAQIAAALVGGVPLSMGFMSNQIMGAQANELLDKGVSPDRALAAGVFNTIVQAPLESLSIGRMTNLIKGGPVASPVLEGVKTVATEMFTEWAQKYPEAFSNIWAQADMNGQDFEGVVTQFVDEFWEITKEGMYEGLVAAPFGGVMGSPAILNSYLNAKQAERVQTWRDQQVELHTAIQASQTMQRSPETMKAFGDILGLGEEAWIDAEALSQRSPELLQRIGVDPEVVARAAQDGTPVKLNTAALMYEAEYPDLLQDLRPSPSAMSAREAGSYDPVQALRDIEEAAIDAETVVAEVVAVKDRMRQTLEARGLGEQLDADWELAVRFGRALTPKGGDPTAFVQKLNIAAAVVERQAGSQVDQQADTIPLMQDPVASIGININDSTQPFTEQILTGEKTIETRNSDSLRPYVGRRVGIVRTGLGQAQLVGYATVGEPKVYTSEEEFRADEAAHRVAAGSAFDFKGRKYGYPMLDVERVDPRPLASRGIIARSLQQDAAYAGVENEAEVEEAGRLWAEMGTESPYFKRWFGNTPMVDEDGDPIAVYHWSQSPTRFQVFDLKLSKEGFHFGSYGQAMDRMEQVLDGGDGGVLFKTYLRGERMITIEDFEENDPYSVAMQLLEQGVISSEDFRKVQYASDMEKDFAATFGREPKTPQEELADILGDNTIIRYENKHEGGYSGEYSYAVFNPTQIKSATGNRGTFDPADARILYQPRQRVDEATGLPLNPDGTVTVYHHTSADKAAMVEKTGRLVSAGEPHVYVTTRKEADTGYGDTAVPIRVDPEMLELDDEFPDGRTDYRISVGKPGGSVKVGVGPWGQQTLGALRAQLKEMGFDEFISERADSISVSKIALPKEARGQGLGSKAMQMITQYADSVGKRVVLSPSKDFGASSVDRLKKFYKRFGFVENKGRNKDYSISDTMYREPRARAELYQPELTDRIVNALNSQEGPATSDEVAAPPTLYQVQNLPEWKDKTRAWMQKNGYSRDEISRHMAAIEGQMKIFGALGPVQLEMLPQGAGIAPAKGKISGPIRSNADAIYKITFDASAMCVKRLEAAATAAEVERRLGRPLVASERMALVALFKSAGKQAPCLYCYVEAPRSKRATLMQQAQDVIQGNTKPKSSWSAKTKNALAAAQEEYNALGLTEIDPRVVTDPEFAETPEGKELRKRMPKIFAAMELVGAGATANLPKLYEEYNGQILALPQKLLDELNNYAGLRFFSSSDFQAEHVADLMQAFFDMELRRAKSHAYTKVPDYVRIFGPTGQKIQTSIFAKEENGEIVMDDWQGMDWETARAFREQYPNVGTVLVAGSDAIVAWGLEQDWVDYIIPFHYSGLEKKFYETLGWQDFTATQNEKSIGKGKAKKIRMHETGAVGGITTEQGTRNYLALAMERKLVPVFPAFLFKDGAEPVLDKKGKPVKNQRLAQTKRAVERWKAMVAAGEIDWDVINPNYYKVKKDYARTDTPFEPVRAEFNLDQADNVLQAFLRGEAPSAKVDADIADKLQGMITSAPVGFDIGVDALAKVRQGITLNQAAWHGSPYKFSKFSLDHMGSGEGAQAYGWGLYFAGKKEVAEFYRKNLSPTEFTLTIGDTKYNVPDHYNITSTPEGRLVTHLFDTLDKGYTSDFALDDARYVFAKDQAVLDVLGDATSVKKEKAKGGQLYKVEIHEDDVMLHWDRPLSEQPEKVREALGFGSAEEARSYWRSIQDRLDAATADLDMEAMDSYDYLEEYGARADAALTDEERAKEKMAQAFMDNRKGVEFYRNLQVTLGSDKAASEYLNSLGIKGIKYLDGTSRSQGEGSYNYVIFDDQTIQILETFYQQQQTGPRGAYNQLKDGSHLVRLFEQANASTMPHELAHAFLTELRAMAETGVADEAMLNDLQKIEAWLDREAVEGSPEWQSYYEDGLAQGMNEAHARERAMFILRHEKFSRGFEQYLWEGKAPEPELEGVFARFSRWLKEIYKTAMEFGVNLDPEIRSVFDRMLKADAEVESKVMELGFTPMTQALAKHLGLGPEDRDYAVRLYSAALEKAEAKLAQARNKGLRKLRAEWKKDAIEEAKNSPVHQMLYTLRKGRGIDKAEFLALYGDEAAKGLPRGVLREGGLSLNEAAFEHNYDTHEQMVNDLWNYRKPEDIAAEVVEARTAERDATFKVEDYILETAEFAAYQELMAKAYDKDGNVLSNKAFRDYARKIVATMPLADAMDVRGFLAAMARHHKAETKALKAGKLADAAKANKKARLNHAYAQEALNVRKRVEKAERMAKRLTKLKAGQIEEGHHKALLQLIQRFGLTKKDYSGLQDVPALADLVKLQDAFGADEEASFSQWLLSGEARNYKDLTSGEFEELQDLMKFLYGTGKDMIRPTLKVSGLDMQDVRDQIVPQIEALPKRGKRRKEGTWLRKMQDQVQSYLSQNRTILWIIRELDGYTALKGVVGPLEKWLYEPLEAANLKRAELSRQLEKRTRKARAQLLKSATAKANKVSLVNLPVPPAWQRQGRVWDFDACLSVLMNMGNAVNRQRVMDGYNLTEQDLQQILAVFSQKDAQAVQDIWDAMDEILWPEIAGTHKKLRFYTPGKVQAEAFTMPDGTVLRGGYYPLKYDPSADTRAARNQDLDKAVQNPATAMLPKSVASGATKARAASAGGMPVLLRTSVLSGHLDWAVHYASHALVIHDLGRILGDKEIAEAIKTAAGEETFRAANELVKRIANPRAGDLPTFLDKVFGKLTGISAVYSMWMNRFGPLTQPTAIGNYIAAEGGWGKGTATWMKGAAHFMANPAKQWNWLMENNAALKNHFTLIRQQLSNAIGEDFRDIQLGKTKSGRIWTATKETVIRGGIAMYGVMDAVVSVPGWYGSYLRGLDENLSPEDAIIRANKVMAEYTPMSREMDKTLFQHTKGMARAWTYMMSYFTKQANTNAGYWKAWRQGAIKTDQFIGQIVAVQILPAVVVSMMYSLLTGDDDDRDNILLDAGLEVAAYPFAGLPFAREGAAWAANLARAGITGDTKKLGRNAFQMPGMMYLQLMQRAGSTTYAMVQDFDDDEAQAKALMAMAELTAATAGLPPVPKVAKEVMRGLDDIDDDEGNILNVLIKPKIRKRD